MDLLGGHKLVVVEVLKLAVEFGIHAGDVLLSLLGQIVGGVSALGCIGSRAIGLGGGIGRLLSLASSFHGLLVGSGDLTIEVADSLLLFVRLLLQGVHMCL